MTSGDRLPRLVSRDPGLSIRSQSFADHGDQAVDRKKKDSRCSRPVGHNADLYKERNTLERPINKLKA
ncbi:hypothetical protein GCM10009647_083020 [Streptomyces sanglieri]